MLSNKITCGNEVNCRATPSPGYIAGYEESSFLCPCFLVTSVDRKLYISLHGSFPMSGLVSCIVSASDIIRPLCMVTAVRK